MIALISGTVEDKKEKYLIIVTSGGVGYKVGATTEALSKINVGQSVKLHIYSHIREDAFDLYGFESKSELGLFELLLSVSGIGPKTAITVMSSGSVADVTAAIAKGDTDFFTQTPGLGTKGAQRIIVDLRNKVGAVGDLDLSAEKESENKQITEALKGFGFKEYEAREAVKALPKNSELTIEQKIKLALKSLSR
ncbi:MAG: Holliday junction branch migration protein RuvA [Patescibacteria group bacterium]|nr:Holliday junction branch migration protein RuvA [Patescibacteria group bacterium]